MLGVRDRKFWVIINGFYSVEHTQSTCSGSGDGIVGEDGFVIFNCRSVYSECDVPCYREKL